MDFPRLFCFLAWENGGGIAVEKSVTLYQVLEDFSGLQFQGSLTLVALSQSRVWCAKGLLGKPANVLVLTGIFVGLFN